MSFLCMSSCCLHEDSFITWHLCSALVFYLKNSPHLCVRGIYFFQHLSFSSFICSLGNFHLIICFSHLYIPGSHMSVLTCDIFFSPDGSHFTTSRVSLFLPWVLSILFCDLPLEKQVFFQILKNKLWQMLSNNISLSNGGGPHIDSFCCSFFKKMVCFKFCL